MRRRAVAISLVLILAGLLPARGGRRDHVRCHQHYRVQPRALCRYGKEVLRSRKPEDRRRRGGLRGRRVAAARGGIAQRRAGCDRSVLACHPARRADPHRRRRRGERAVPPRRREDRQELERSAAQDDQRRRPHRRHAVFPPRNGAQQWARRPRLRSALRRRHAQPLRAARIRRGRCGDPDQSGGLRRARARLCRSRQRAAVSAELGAEQHRHRHPLGGAAPRRAGRFPSRPHQGDALHLRPRQPQRNHRSSRESTPDPRSRSLRRPTISISSGR